MSAERPDISGADTHFRMERRVLVAESPLICGLDRVEFVSLADGCCSVEIHFIEAADPAKSAIPDDLAPAQVILLRAHSGEPGRPALELRRDPKDPSVLTAEFAAPPEFMEAARDGLALVQVRGPKIDPLLCRAVVQLPRAGPVTRDPAAPPAAPEDPGAVDVSYLAKDFDSYKRLMLDHIAVLQPQWRERHPADMANALVDILAYAADNLSYYQDAVGTEAYLGTARRRVSLKRHARLLDYRGHEGCSARVWVQIKVSREACLRAGLPLLCSAPRPGAESFRVESLRAPPADGLPVFQTMVDARLFPEHDRLEIYAWGARDYAVGPGDLTVALVGHHPRLVCGDVLIFTEEIDPLSGDPKGADRAHRHAVRLDRDPKLDVDRLSGDDITQIWWSRADALPFDLQVARSAGGRTLTAISVARGNIVPADCGFTVTEDLEPAPRGGAGVYRPTLSRRDLIYSVPYDAAARSAPARAFTAIDARSAEPAIDLEELGPGGAEGRRWLPVRDLLGSDRFAREMVVETEADGYSALRFGDDWNGLAPRQGDGFRATYRIGRCTTNLEAETINSWAPRAGDDFVIGVSNPLRVAGGQAPETADQIRLRAPLAFRRQRRCVIGQDYVDALMADPRVRAVVPAARWTGSWNTTFLHVQLAEPGRSDAAVLDEIAAGLEPLRIVGGDYALREPRYAPIRIGLSITVKPPYALIDVQRKVVQAIRRSHRLGALTFGQTLYLSPIVAAAMAEPGVTDVRVRDFRRCATPRGTEPAPDRLLFGATEIPTIDDHPVADRRGVIAVHAVAAAPP
jgi:hypothetical protein